MTNPSIDDYKKVCSILQHIPKRERAKAKRKIKRYALSVLDPTHQNRSEALRIYRRSWQEFASGEGKDRPWVAPKQRQK